MENPRKFHLFNCDSIYDLNVVEDLLRATKAKLGFEFSVEKHNFTLSEMSELSTKTIPEMRMDFAIFVVHAHESGLFINHDNLEYGYTKVYRALLQATGGNVINVIGGDDNYKDEDEEDRDFISRWAKRKICSQFREEFLDGRKGFIFSWNKRHRAIHEAALLHHFDPSRKGQKFKYQPPVLATEPVHPPRLYRSFALPEERTKQMNDKQELPSSRKSPLQKDQAVTGPRTEDIQPYMIYKFDTTSACTTPFHRKQGARPKEMLPPSLERPKAKDLAILGCNVLQSSMQDARKVFQDIVPKLNLSEPPAIENFPSPIKVKEYLMDNHLRYCALVVDADRINYAHGYQPQVSSEYRQLLETAANQVVAKVFILVCNSNTLNLAEKDEVVVNETIEYIVNERGKGFVARLNNGKLALDENVLVKFLMSPMPDPRIDAQMNLSRGFQQSSMASPVSSNAGSFSRDLRNFRGDHLQRDPSEGERIHGKGVQTMQQLAPGAPEKPPPLLMLRSIVRFGKISYEIGDLQIWYPEFKVPDYINHGLLQKYGSTPAIGVRVYRNNVGKLAWAVDPKLRPFRVDRGILFANETLMLKTRVRYGEVSFDELDLQFKYGKWEVPQYVTDGLREEHKKTPCGDLYMFLKTDGTLRCKVEVAKTDQAASYVWQKLTSISKGLTESLYPKNSTD